MKRATITASLLLSALLSGCSGLQVERDLRHAEDAEAYQASLQAPVPAARATDCRAGIPLNVWTEIAFAPGTPAFVLPNGVKAAASCLAKPAGARVARLRSYATGGATYFELTLVHPSILAMDGEFALLKDVQKPRLSPGEHFFKGLRLAGNLPLNGELSASEFLLFYVHPLSLSGTIAVQTGYETIPVPYAPYGKIEVRFE
jgi:hypothetical protein